MTAYSYLGDYDLWIAAGRLRPGVREAAAYAAGAYHRRAGAAQQTVAGFLPNLAPRRRASAACGMYCGRGRHRRYPNLVSNLSGLAVGCPVIAVNPLPETPQNEAVGMLIDSLRQLAVTREGDYALVSRREAA